MGDRSRQVRIGAGLLLLVAGGLSVPAPCRSAPIEPASYLQFDGASSYVEVPDSDDFSVPAGGGLTVAAWMKPDVLQFPHTGHTGYVHWLGKGEGSGTTGQQEWTLRMYSDDPDNTERRMNRISFYVFNLDGRFGVGSYFQEPVTPGQWIHVAGVIDDGARRIAIYKNGAPKDSDSYVNDPLAGTITPGNGAAPLRMGTRDFESFFEGGLAEVRLWRRALSASEIADLYQNDAASMAGLAAEYLFSTDTGAVAKDTLGLHDGTIHGATFSIAPVPGDVTGDGRVTVADATLVLRFAVGLAAPTPAQQAAGDINGDGTINVQDAALILRGAVGLG